MFLEEFSFLLNKQVTLELVYPEIRLQAWQSTSVFEVSGALLMVRENSRQINP